MFPVMMRRLHVAVAASVLALAGGAQAKQTPRQPLSIREVYDVALERTSGYLLSARGRTVVETRSGCGMTHTLQRSLADTVYKDGQPVRTDFVIETWEGGDGRSLRFRVRNTQAGYGTERHDGAAILSADGTGRVTFTSRDKPFALPRGTIFPTAFSRAILDAAIKRRDLDSRLVFQGGDRKALVTAAVKIGRRLPAVHEVAKDPGRLLRGAAVWPILISYFPSEAELPVSEVAAHLYSNGLLGSLSLIYRQFTLSAKLLRIEKLRPHC